MNTKLQIGEYFIPEGCTIKRVGKTILVYKKKSNKLPPSEKRCRDCKFFGKGHTVHLYYLANACLKKLLTTCEDIARLNKKSYLYLCVDKGNIWLTEFYKNQGFEVTHVDEHEYQMTKYLSPKTI